MFKQYFEKRKAKREVEVKEFQERSDKARDEIEEKLRLATFKMVNKACPINDGKNCFRECVHFRPGDIWGINKGSYIQWTEYKPECKLWRRE